jgi:error-prone DNA polymerase
MPDPPDPKARMHPYAQRHKPRPAQGIPAGDTRASRRTADQPWYAELAVTSNFTFLTGASHPDEFVQQADALGYAALAVTDHNSLAGVVRGHVAAKETGVRFLVGCRLIFAEPTGLQLLVYPSDRRGYGNLCQLLTTGKRRAAKGACHLTLADLADYQAGLLAVVMPPDDRAGLSAPTFDALRQLFDDDRLSLALTRLYGPEAARREARVCRWAARYGLPLVAINDAYYHAALRRALQDVVTCIRCGCSPAEAGFRLFPNGELYLKSPREMARLFVEHPRALTRVREIVERAGGFSLDELRYEYPDETCPAGLAPLAYLKKLTWRGAVQRYPRGVPAKVRRQLAHEFALIEELDYAPYFLTVYDLVAFARSRGILCQGRGAAANSAVCFCLGVTSVDPDRMNILFERFVSRERDEPPDIDIDFEHERREEVIQYIYAKYGRDRAGLTAEVITYRRRSAVRDVGKVLGFSLDAVERIAKRVDRWEVNPFADATLGDVPAQLQALGYRADDPTVRLFVQLVREIIGFPRHLSQHVGGFVMTRGPLNRLVPIENAAMPERTVIEWDKDDIEALGMLKVDVLGLGMLTCIRKGLALVADHHGRALTLATIPAEDPQVYDMICRADTVGVFQVESRAQMTMLPRLKPRCYYDLVIEVAIVRPGPIIGQMVHPYLRRRNGEEPADCPDETVREVLGRTLGVPLFQEQVMALAVKAAGFTPGEAERLRRAITAWTSKDKVVRYTAQFIRGMLANGYSREFADWCFQRMKGFSQYGFPESHAASFALLVYASAWIKCHYPAVFAAALLNSQPLGFYAPAQIVRDAREHGVEVRGVDVNRSRWDCTLEAGGAVLRLGMRMAKGLKKRDGEAIATAVERSGACATPLALWRASGVSAAALRALARADAFGSMGLDRRHALWEIQNLRDTPLPLFDGLDEPARPVPLPAPRPRDEVARDYARVGLSLANHPIAFLRTRLTREHVLTAAEVKDPRQTGLGRRVAVAGVVLFRQRPGTAKGVMFMTLEDETGRIDLIVRPRIYERYRDAAVYSEAVIARGRVERQGQVVHVLVSAFSDIAERLAG